MAQRVKQKRQPRHRGYMVTTFQEARPELKNGVHYIKGVQENAPTTGKLHWQTTIVCDELTLRQVRKLYPGCDVRVRNGTFRQAYEYCSFGKFKTPPDTTGVSVTDYELGVMPRPGARTDIEEMATAFLQRGYDGVSDTAIIKYHRGLEKLKQVRYKPKSIVKVVKWYWGEAGSGKTRAAYEEAGIDCYMVPTRGGWFDNYQGQKHVVIDEYDASRFSLSEILRLMDRYPEQVPVKGGFVHFEATNLWITSHFEPAVYFPADRVPEVLRRISEVKEFVVLPGPIITPATSEAFLVG